MKLPKTEQKILDQIVFKLNGRDFVAAVELVRQRVANGIDTKRTQDICLQLELGGVLIDIGMEGRLADTIREGLTMLEAYPDLQTFVTESSYEYNLGNAKAGLFDIEAGKPDFISNLSGLDLLIQSKNHFWRAYKSLGAGPNAIRSQVLVNLGNTMAKSGRVAEALDCYETVLAEHETFAPAILQRTWGLLKLRNLAGGCSSNLVAQAMSGFEISSNSPDLPPYVREEARAMGEGVAELIVSSGTKLEKISRHFAEAKAEATSQLPYRRFCLDKRLTLSEHSLYCDCLVARRDDLMVTTPAEPLSGDFVPRMELIVNRLKSEFGLARMHFYESMSVRTRSGDDLGADITFTELFEGESISLSSEKLRTSFRLCFGMLDKIARGLCELFDLAEPNENIYFESFWKPQGKKGRQAVRWQRLNDVGDNHALLALYSQATDLNHATGEWADFKEWRNCLEHGILLLTDPGGASAADPFATRNFGAEPTVLVGEVEFRERTLQLLRFTRSAIFSFVFCVRQEARKRDNQRPTTAISLRYKAGG